MQNPLVAESRLPADVLARASLSGNEYAWRRLDLPLVFAAAEAAGIANVGGQVQFRFEDGTCELYWREFGPSERQDDEPWEAWVRRSRLEAEKTLSRLPTDDELVAEAISDFDFLREKAVSGVNVNEALYFVCYFSVDSEQASRTAS